MKEKLKTAKTIHISLTLDEYKQFYAYAHVKGFGIKNPIGTFARIAMNSEMNRHAPTEAQMKRVEEIIKTFE